MMTRGLCRYCGVEVFYAGPPGERVPLDVHESHNGPNRYRITGDGELVPVDPTADVAAYVDHRASCWRQRGVVTQDGSLTAT